MKRFILIGIIAFTLFALPIKAMAKIVYTLDRTGTGICDIWKMDDDGSDQINLTQNVGNNLWGKISHKGEKIVFWSNRDELGLWDLYTMNSDGSNIIKIADLNSTDAGFPLIWSPDDTQIVFYTNYTRPIDSKLYIINADGTNQEEILYRGTGTWNQPSDWSSDGKYILITLSNAGNAYSCEIYKYNIINRSLDDRLTNDGLLTANGVYSPDMSRIAFMTENPIGTADVNVYVSSADKSSLWPADFQLTNDGMWNDYPYWISNSSLIYSKSKNVYGIWSINADGTNNHQLTTSGFAPSWSPDIMSGPPQLQTTPTATYDFGSVEFETTNTMVLDLTNNGQQNLIINNIAFESVSMTFSYTLNTPLPLILLPGNSVEMNVAFTPPFSLDPQSNSLVITSNDPLNSTTTILFTGTGAFSTNSSSAVSELQQYLAQSIQDGSLVGVGPGSSGDNKVAALQKMIISAGNLISSGNITQACAQLASIHSKVDGMPKPPDFVDGNSKPAIATEIQNIMILNCQ